MIKACKLVDSTRIVKFMIFNAWAFNPTILLSLWFLTRALWTEQYCWVYGLSILYTWNHGPNSFHFPALWPSSYGIAVCVNNFGTDHIRLSFARATIYGDFLVCVLPITNRSSNRSQNYSKNSFYHPLF